MSENEAEAEQAASEALGCGCFILVPGLMVFALGLLMRGGYFIPEWQSARATLLGGVASAIGVALIAGALAYNAKSRGGKK